jgi:catechol 2,3-dioxygenase-like lactoylglutathione lyase family enzyme
MRFQSRALIALTGLVFASSVVHVQTPAPLADSRIDHISVAVRDFERTLPKFEDVLGIDPPAVVRTLTLQTPDGSKVPMKIVDLNLSNFDIEVDQPNGGPGPTQEFLDRYGPAIQLFGQAVTKPLEPRIKALVGRGGRWTLGPPGAVYAWVNMMPLLGTTIDLEPMPSSEAGKGVHAGELASYPVVHVGFLSSDAEATAKAFSDVFGGTPSPARVMKSPPLKVVQLGHAGTTIEIDEPVGRSGPGADFLARRKGPGAHHVAFDVGDKVDEIIGTLQAKGGKLTLGRRGSGYAWLDFSDSLGLVIEVIDGGKK